MSAMRERIIEMYGPQILRRSCMGIRNGAGVLERCLKDKGYGTVIEIGTYRGVAAAEMSQYCERVVTFDLKNGRLEQLGEPFDRYAFWTSLGIYNVELALVESDIEKAEIIDGMQFDFAFVDGAHHDPEIIAADFNLVKRCGRVLFHDYDRRGVVGQDYVCDFVDSLPKHQVEKLDIFALWTNK